MKSFDSAPSYTIPHHFQVADRLFLLSKSHLFFNAVVCTAGAGGWRAPLGPFCGVACFSGARLPHLCGCDREDPAQQARRTL